MDNRIKDKAETEVEVINKIIFELFFFENDVGENSELSNSISKILENKNVNKDSDLWKKSWRMYYDWVHFTNWRRKKNESKENVSKRPDNDDYEAGVSNEFAEEEDFGLPF